MIVSWDNVYTPSWQGWGGGPEPAYDGGAWSGGSYMYGSTRHLSGLEAVPSFCAPGFVGPLTPDQQATCATAGTVDTLQLPDGSLVNLNQPGGAGNPAAAGGSIFDQIKPYALPIGLGLGAVVLLKALMGGRR